MQRNRMLSNNQQTSTFFFKVSLAMMKDNKNFEQDTSRTFALDICMKRLHVILIQNCQKFKTIMFPYPIRVL